MPTATATDPSLPDLIRANARDLPDPLTDPERFGAKFDSLCSGARVVLLGEASHGTSELYRSRAAITQRLIQNHGFDIVAVEADWPDASTINRYVKHKRPMQPPPSAEKVPFTRFSSWMWQNADVARFIPWLRFYNGNIKEEDRVGFYGLDLYNLNPSMRSVLEYLQRVDPEAARIARSRYGCLAPWAKEPAEYGAASLRAGYAKCEKGVVQVQRDLLEQHLAGAVDEDDVLNAEACARLVTNAERYYRAMFYGGEESWNLRDTHFFETLQSVLEAKGPNAKAVVWPHNSHVGDARYTDMGAERGELNIGQLCREHYGDAVRIIGFGTHTGTVAAADEWDDPMRVMRVVPSREDSCERVFHETDIPRFFVDLRGRKAVEDVNNEEGESAAAMRRQLMAKRRERFIGVIYRPRTELWSHYSFAVLPRQFDAYVWFDTTSAVQPMDVPQKPSGPGAEETYPFGY
ncbi:erythromycin esterase-domain-containing protein [Schizophyllum commune]